MLQRLEPLYSLVDFNDYFKLVCTTVDEQGMPMRDDVLIVEKRGCVIYSRRKSKFKDLMTHLVVREEKDEQGPVIRSCHGVIGILNIGNQIFVVLIKRKQLAATMPSGDNVYLIREVDLVPFDKNFEQFSEMN